MKITIEVTSIYKSMWKYMLFFINLTADTFNTFVYNSMYDQLVFFMDFWTFNVHFP